MTRGPLDREAVGCGPRRPRPTPPLPKRIYMYYNIIEFSSCYYLCISQPFSAVIVVDMIMSNLNADPVQGVSTVILYQKVGVLAYVIRSHLIPGALVF